MPTMPSVKYANLNHPSWEIMNVIRNSSSPNYKGVIPTAQADNMSCRAIGNIMMQNADLRNEFLSALMNRIGFVVVTSRIWNNPLKMFKRGNLDVGETVEEIFVDLCKPHQHNAENAENTWMKRELPQVLTAFHSVNFKKFYKITIERDQLRTAFTSWANMDAFIANCIETMVTSAETDEYAVLKYLIARLLINGQFKPVTIAGTDTSEHCRSTVAVMRATSNKFTVNKTDYNPAGVYNHSSRDNQYLILNAEDESKISVDVLAQAFNLDKAELLGHEVIIDGFGEFDEARMTELFADDPYNSYTAFTAEQKAALNAIPAVMVDKDFFMVFGNLEESTDSFNGEGLYYQNWLHRWLTISASPFANRAAFIVGTPGITSVTVTPATATAAKKTAVQFSATVVATNFAPQGVVWSCNSTKSTISQNGMLTVAADETASSIKVTATSEFDGSKKGQATVTVS